MLRLDFLIQTFFEPLLVMLARGFPILHRIIVYQVICLEDQVAQNLPKHSTNVKVFVKFLSYLVVTPPRDKYPL